MHINEIWYCHTPTPSGSIYIESAKTVVLLLLLNFIFSWCEVNERHALNPFINALFTFDVCIWISVNVKVWHCMNCDTNAVNWSELILSVNVCVAITRMLNFEGDANVDVKCERILTNTVAGDQCKSSVRPYPHWTSVIAIMTSQTEGSSVFLF